MEETQSPRSRTTTFILSLLIIFGFAGVHRIYAGKVWTGILQFFTLGGFVVWQVIDIIMLLGGAFRDKEERII
ncbi:MAG: TM2 domain-containing protein [Akkermansia sp.]|nr:TM2 domain-containing protein [Akkermansia sp.]